VANPTRSNGSGTWLLPDEVTLFATSAQSGSASAQAASATKSSITVITETKRRKINLPQPKSIEGKLPRRK
jgi:hypothetical protein